MIGYNDSDETLFGPQQVAMYFQFELNRAGNPIKFTEQSALPTQRVHARKLLEACGYRRAEVTAIIREYCQDDWWVKHQPSLAQVVKQADKLRARIAARQQQQDDFSWEDYERRRVSHD